MVRRTAKSFCQHVDSVFWPPLDVVGCGSEWDFGIRENSVNRDGGVVDCSHHGREPRPSSVVTVFVPPAIFTEVQAIFDSPVIPDVPENISCRNGLGIETGNEVAFVTEHDLAVICHQLTIDSHHDFTIGQVKCFSDVVSVV